MLEAFMRTFWKGDYFMKPIVDYEGESIRSFEYIEKLAPDTEEYTTALANYQKLRCISKEDTKSDGKKFLELHGGDLIKAGIYVEATGALLFLDWHPTNCVSRRIMDIIRKI
jgi:hypothetical protein